MKAPLRSTYGTVGMMDKRRQRKEQHQQVRLAFQQRPRRRQGGHQATGSPHSFTPSRQASGSYETNTPLRRESSSTVATSIDGMKYQDLHRAAVLGQAAGSTQNSFTEEPFIVEWAARTTRCASSGYPTSRSSQAPRRRPRRTKTANDSNSSSNTTRVTAMRTTARTMAREGRCIDKSKKVLGANK